MQWTKRVPSTHPGVNLTYTDYLTFPADGNRHELLAGEHVVSASPVPRHQVLVKRLLLQLHAAIEQPKLGEVMVSPSDIVLSDEDVVQPDLYVMLGKNAIRLQQQQVIGPPDLAVEVLSPSTAAIDRGLKRAVFARHGVREYWVLDPDQNVLEQYVLAGRSLQLHAVHTTVVELTVAPGAKVDLTKVW